MYATISVLVEHTEVRRALVRLHEGSSSALTVQSLDQLGHLGDMMDDSEEILCPCEQFWHGHRCPLFDVVHPYTNNSPASRTLTHIFH